MPAADLPADEAERLRSLRELSVLDTAPEAEFEALVHAASLVCNAPISLLSLVDEDRQWFKANLGLEGTAQTHRSHAFCAHALHGDDIFEVEDATRDVRFQGNPLVAGAPDVRFYAGAPLVLADGSRVGTLCVIDRQPRRLDARQREILAHLARAASKALEGRRAALQLQASEEQQRGLYAALEEEHRRRGEFLATLAHELRNPLSAIRSGTQLLKLSSSNPAGVDRVAGMLERQVGHMTRLVDDLTGASEADAGKLTLQLEAVELRLLIAAALEASLPAIERGHHDLRVDVPEMPLFARLDRVRMVQVISNLLVNAAKYTPHGGSIGLRASVDAGSALRIEVSDNGIGIAPDGLARIFGMFVQVGDGTAPRGGLGIGLAVVERLVGLHGGTVAAASAGLGQGSTFAITLPGVICAGPVARTPGPG